MLRDPPSFCWTPTTAPQKQSRQVEDTCVSGSVGTIIKLQYASTL